MTYLLHILLFLIARYLHIVCATVLVGGTAAPYIRTRQALL
jgi:hypothetical protein